MGRDDKPDCDDLLDHIHDFLHGELDEGRTARLRDHLDACQSCFETADFQAQLRQIVAKRCCEEVPADFQLRLVARLRVEAADSAGPGAPS